MIKVSAIETENICLMTNPNTKILLPLKIKNKKKILITLSPTSI